MDLIVISNGYFSIFISPVFSELFPTALFVILLFVSSDAIFVELLFVAISSLLLAGPFSSKALISAWAVVFF